MTLFATDNNGVILELPAVAAAGATTTTGSLVFGIGTRTNNGLGSATVLSEDPNTAFISATYKTKVYADSYLDSGSNGNFFTDSIPLCASPNQVFYCPTAPTMVSETAMLTGANSVTLSAAFTVTNLANYPNGAFALPGLGGPNGDTMGFDLGLPFFYGHNVFTAVENANTPGGVGPYFAY